jgi:AbrB family looped-hinge helix DNA binding protein
VATTVTSKGQVTVPKAVRDYLGIKAGSAVTFERLVTGTQIETVEVLDTTQTRGSDLARGKISQFSLGMLIRLATRAGLHPMLKLAA